MFTGMILAFALRFPGAANILAKMFGVIKRYWKVFAAVIIVVASWWWFTSWRDNLIETADKDGYDRRNAEVVAMIEAVNERERKTQSTLDRLTEAFSGLSTQREQAINITVRPRIERITNEVSIDPRYRECFVSDSVLDDLNAGRATVDQGIATTNPGGN